MIDSEITRTWAVLTLFCSIFVIAGLLIPGALVMSVGMGMAWVVASIAMPFV